MHLSSHAQITPRRGLFCRGRLEALRIWIRDWARTSANYYTAATRYEYLANCGEDELARLGFSRSTLARDLIQVCERQRFVRHAPYAPIQSHAGR